MRHDQFLRLDHGVVPEEKVEIQSARAPAHHALAVCLDLDLQQAAQQRVRVELRGDHGDHVQVRALVLRPAHGVGLEDLRLGKDLRQVLDAVAQVGHAITQVAAERHDRAVLLHHDPGAGHASFLPPGSGSG